MINLEELREKILDTEVKNGTTVSCVANYVGAPVMDAIMETIAKELNYNKAHNLSLDYDLFVLDPSNKDSTPRQIRDSIYDAIRILDERTS